LSGCRRRRDLEIRDNHPVLKMLFDHPPDIFQGCEPVIDTVRINGKNRALLARVETPGFVDPEWLWNIGKLQFCPENREDLFGVPCLT